MKKVIIKVVCTTCMFSLFNSVMAQSKAAKSPTVVAWDGMAVGGYVNHGGFVNFGGPLRPRLRAPEVVDPEEPALQEVRAEPLGLLR